MSVTAAEVDQLLPQTQCRKCGYVSCMAYAEALVQREISIDHCPPGGETTRRLLGQLLGVAPGERALHPQPSNLTAIVDEPDCIGCTKCIQVCPVDAIVGAAGLMHTVVADWCTGCELCIPVCPTDCITMEAPGKNKMDPENARRRFQARNARLVASNETRAATEYVSLDDLTPDKLNEELAEVLARRRK